MILHSVEAQHKLGLSFADGSFWCYPCESYVDSIGLRPARKLISNLKTKEEDEKKGKPKKSEEEKEKDKEEVNLL